MSTLFSRNSLLMFVWEVPSGGFILSTRECLFVLHEFLRRTDPSRVRFWTSMAYKLPRGTAMFRGPTFQGVDLDRDTEQWRYYPNQPEESRTVPRKPGLALLTAFHHAELYRLVQKSLPLYSGTRGKLHVEALMNSYLEFVMWWNNLPDSMSDGNANVQPHMVFLQYVVLVAWRFPLPANESFRIQYHTALVQLFVPLLHAHGFSKSSLDTIRSIVVDHAVKGLSLVEDSRKRYSSRFHMPLEMFCVVQLGEVLLRYSPQEPEASTVAEFCLEILKESRSGFACSGPLQDLFYETAEECGVVMTQKMRDLVDVEKRYVGNGNDFRHACGKESYTAVMLMARNIDPSFADGWPSQWGLAIATKAAMSNAAKSKRLTSNIIAERGNRSLDIASILNADND